MRRRCVGYIVSIFVSAICRVPALADSGQTKQWWDQYARSERKLDMLVALIKEKGAGRDSVRLYLAGALEGLDWANSDLSSKHQSKLYCAPSTLTLNSDNAADIIAVEYSKNWRAYQIDSLQKIGREGLSYLLLNGLESTFPCK